MELEAVKKYLEKGGDKSVSTIDGLPLRFFERLTMEGLRVDLIEPGRLICSFKVPTRLVVAVIFTVGAPATGVSVEINVSYLDAAYVDEEIEVEARALRVGKAVGVVSVELRKKKTGKIIAQGRHTKYLPVASKL
ncbi:hypothetical protein FH972_020917 [Carpinus fangiana]|uniref:Thioesterase domain-containing protein n=1 Tax=Carpinus fangiana TaxID=176857 RepID=A0A5N6RZ58_9ROSI|nr:hypothetical protein FH972_020917 [Carpinus fangiana]